MSTQNKMSVLSPHLSIYKPQFSSTLSIFNRISGAILSLAVMIYGYVIYYFSTSLCTISSIPVIDISEDIIEKIGRASCRERV